MLEEIEKQIKISDEVLNNLPMNNVKNAVDFKKEVELEINNYKKKAAEILEELKRRITEYDNLSYEDVFSFDEVLKKLKKALMYTNNLSTSYEKLNFDKIVYQLTHYNEEDLIANNRNILKAINTFKVADVLVTNKDFNYTNFVSDYMRMFFEGDLTTLKIKKTFDKTYWQCPDIMLQIELNLRYLYTKHKKKMEVYVEKVNKDIENKAKSSGNTVLDNYNSLRKRNENLLNRNNLILDFYSGKKDIDDYTDEKIQGILDNLFTDSDFNNRKIDIVKQFKYSLIEYKNYLKYEDLITKIKTLYGETLEKNFMASKMKKINGLEGKLFKLNKKDSHNKSKTSVNKLEPAINGVIGEIKQLYDEIDSNMFKIIVKEHIKENSTIFKSLLLICQYYVVLADYFKEEDPEITYEQIGKEIDMLYDFIMNPNNTLINNVTVLEECDIKNMVVTNYKMLNLKIDESLITDDGIDSIISDLDKIIMNDNLKKLGIPINKLCEAKLIKMTLDKNNAM